MNQHSPTPWRIVDEVDIAAADGLLVVMDGRDGGFTEIHGGMRANAAYVVRCVNSHEALVKALAGLMTYYVQCFGTGNAECVLPFLEAREALKQLETTHA